MYLFLLKKHVFTDINIVGNLARITVKINVLKILGDIMLTKKGI